VRRKLLDVLFIVGLGAGSAALLFGAQSYSAPAVRRYQERRLKTTVLAAAGIEVGLDHYERLFAERASRRDAGSEGFFVVDSLIIYEFRGRGLWGMIEGVITYDSTLSRIKGVRVMAQEETPGLGSRIAEAGYLQTYRDKTTAVPLVLAMRHVAVSEDEVDAIAGATLSTQALLRTVNDATRTLWLAVKGEGR
jgi:hypothetical protein